MICFECGKQADYKHHVVPKSKGGEKTIPLCGVCHGKIHDFQAIYINELTRCALAHKRAKGEKTGGDVPFGYRARNGKLIPDATEQKAVGMILNLHAAGMSLRGICRRLEAAGVARKNGSTSWHPQIVADILRREEK